MTDTNRPISVEKVDIEKWIEAATPSQRRRAGDRIALAVVMLMLIASGFASSIYTQRLRTHTNLVAQSHKLLGLLDNIECKVHVAESGQRGFLISGLEEHLTIYQIASNSVSSLIKELGTLTQAKPITDGQIAKLEGQILRRMAELASAIDVGRNEGFEAARTVVASNLGISTMESIRDSINETRAM